MLVKCDKKKSRLTLFAMLLGLTLIAGYLMTRQHCVCTLCMFIDPSTMKPLDQEITVAVLRMQTNFSRVRLDIMIGILQL